MMAVAGSYQFEAANVELNDENYRNNCDKPVVFLDKTFKLFLQENNFMFDKHSCEFESVNDFLLSAVEEMNSPAKNALTFTTREEARQQV